MLNNIKILKRYFKVTLNVFNNKKKFLMMTKKIYLYDRFLCQIEVLLINMLKLFNIPSFSGFPFFFCKNCQIPVFFFVFQGFQVKWQPCTQKTNQINYFIIFYITMKIPYKKNKPTVKSRLNMFCW